MFFKYAKLNSQTMISVSEMCVRDELIQYKHINEPSLKPKALKYDLIYYIYYEVQFISTYPAASFSESLFLRHEIIILCLLWQIQWQVCS